MKNYNKQDEFIVLLFYSAHCSTYSRLILVYSHWFRTLILCNVQLTMKFKLFNATTMHNSTENAKKFKKSKKIRFKLKKI